MSRPSSSNRNERMGARLCKKRSKKKSEEDINNSDKYAENSFSEAEDGEDLDSCVDDWFPERGHAEHMRQMEQMFPSFGGLGHGMRALPGPAARDNRRRQQQAQNMQVAERGVYMDPFAHFDSMFSNMRSMMTDMHQAFGNVQSGPNSQVFQQSSFMSYSNTGNGAPKIYQASTSSHQGPGGVKETRRTVRDSESGVEKVSVGHHINDRSHVIERSRNRHTGEENENQEYINLDEEEAAPFDQEYQDKWRSSTMRGIEHRRHAERSRHAPVGNTRRVRHAALPEPENYRQRKPSYRRE